MRNHDLIAAVRSRCDMDHWSDPFRSFVDRDFEVTRTLNIKNVEITKFEIVKWSELSDQVLIGTIDRTPFRGFEDRDLESRYASSPDSQNAKSRKCLMHKAVVTALGHISERWRKELEKPSSFSGITTGNVMTLAHTNVEQSKAKMLKWMQDPLESIQRCRWIWTWSEGYCCTSQLINQLRFS